MNTGELKQFVAARFCAPAYGLLWEVGNSTGFGCNRHCDGLAMSLWPSRGLELIGLELKVSRGDWVKELKAPEKAEAIARFCDKWYLVVSDTDFVKPGELPAAWGLLAPRGKSLTTIKEATHLSPVPVTRNFLAAIFRQATEQGVDKAAMKAAHAVGYQEGSEYAKQQAERSLKDTYRELNELREVLAEFRRETGITLGTGRYEWNGNAKIIGKAVKLVLAGKHRRDLDELANIEAAADRAKAAVAELRDLYAREGT